MAKKRGVKRLVFLFILLILLAVPLAYLLVMPDISSLKRKTPHKTSFMKYREKEWAEKRRGYKITQTVVPLSKISPYLLKAVLIAEDDKFWKHEGFDFESMQKALEKDLQAGKFKSGGSTVTQQLARNLYLSPEKSLLRKGAEGGSGSGLYSCSFLGKGIMGSNLFLSSVPTFIQRSRVS